MEWTAVRIDLLPVCGRDCLARMPRHPNVRIRGCPRGIGWGRRHASCRTRRGQGDRRRKPAATEEEERHPRRLVQEGIWQKIELAGPTVRDKAWRRPWKQNLRQSE